MESMVSLTGTDKENTSDVASLLKDALSDTS
jgi:hypothetical protein